MRVVSRSGLLRVEKMWDMDAVGLNLFAHLYVGKYGRWDSEKQNKDSTDGHKDIYPSVSLVVMLLKIGLDSVLLRDQVFAALRLVPLLPICCLLQFLQNW